MTPSKVSDRKVCSAGPANHSNCGHADAELAPGVDSELAQVIANCHETPASLNEKIHDSLEAAEALLPVCAAPEDK